MKDLVPDLAMVPMPQSPLITIHPYAVIMVNVRLFIERDAHTQLAISFIQIRV